MNNEEPARARRVRYPTVGIKIKFKTIDSDEWQKAEIMSKVDLYKDHHMFNIKPEESEELRQLDFQNDVTEWKHYHENDEATAETYIISTREREEIDYAKTAELENWKRYHVYDEVEDKGQDRVSVKWVIKQKIKENRLTYKGRLVARGYEDTSETRNDSPTCHKDSVRIMMAIASAKNWNIEAIDIKAAFMQSQSLLREIHLKPPAEAKCKGKLWRLRRCVYGLNDASRNWYLTMRQEMKNIGATEVKGDPAFFYWKNDEQLIGLLASHVDDFLHCGLNKFKNEKVSKIKEKFEISSEVKEAFEYLGIKLNTTSDGITVNQIEYVNELRPLIISEVRKNNRNDDVTEEERSEMRSAIGKLNWLRTQSRPDIAFQVSSTASQIHKAKVRDIVELNKTIKKVKSEEVFIKFPRLNNLKKCRLVVYADASFAGLDNWRQAAYLIFLVDEYQNAALLTWISKCIHRVVRSVLGAELFALADAVDHAHTLNKIISQILLEDNKKFQIQCYVDSKSLVEAIGTSHTTTERRLMVDIHALREDQDNKEIKVNWIESKRNLADPLTKHTAYSGVLLEALRSGRLNL